MSEEDEYEYEAVPGLPGELPEGETLLWQGAPQWTSMARHVFYVRFVIGYFAILAAWRIFEAAWTGGDMTTAVLSVAWLGVIAATCVALIALIARSMARSTIYSITSRRVVMRIGAALPITVNVPFKSILSANLKTNSDGTGNIALQLAGKPTLGYAHLWPHARPWHLKTPEPMLRNLSEPQAVANLLSKALLTSCPNGSREPVRAGSQPLATDREARPLHSGPTAMGAA